MTPLQTWRLTIALVGVAIFGWGVRTDNETVRWVGIGCLVVSFVLRFLGRREKR